MKTIIKILTLTLAFVAGVASAAPLTYSQYATGGTALGGSALTNYAIIGNNTQLNGFNTTATPVITFLNLYSPSAATVVQFYSCSNYTAATAATSNVRTNTVNSTNGFSIGKVVVVKHLSTDTYERLVLAAPQLTNQIVFASDPVRALAAGDLIYEQTAGGTIGVVTNAGANSFMINLSGNGIYSGQKGYPLLLDTVNVVGTNATIRAVNATFTP